MQTNLPSVLDTSRLCKHSSSAEVGDFCADLTSSVFLEYDL